MCIIEIPVHDWCDCSKALKPGRTGISDSHYCGMCIKCLPMGPPSLPSSSEEALSKGFDFATTVLLAPCYVYGHHVALDCEAFAQIRLCTKESQDRVQAVLHGARRTPRWIHCSFWPSHQADGGGEHTCLGTIWRWEKPWERGAFRAAPVGGPCPWCFPTPPAHRPCRECNGDIAPLRRRGPLRIPVPSLLDAIRARHRGTFAPLLAGHAANERTRQGIAVARARGERVHVSWDRTSLLQRRPVVYLLDPPLLELDPQAPAAQPSEKHKPPCLRGRNA